MPGLTQERLDSLPFYLTEAAPCPYVNGRAERKLFARLNDDPVSNAQLNGLLCEAGFRRSQDIVYRPACPNCRACVPVRIPVERFRQSRSQRRVMKNNRDLTFGPIEQERTAEVFALFQEYQQNRHKNGDMADMTETQFQSLIDEKNVGTVLYGLKNSANAIKGCILADPVPSGVSAVYSFFTGDDPRRSLGTALILRLIETVREQRGQYVYLGYWIAESRKMNYKTRFRPLEQLGAIGWSLLLDESAETTCDDNP